MHINTLSPETAIFLKLISKTPFLQSFYLSGGTALALHLGHRESEDLDFFSTQEFDTKKLQLNLEGITPLSTVEHSRGTLNAYTQNGVKLQFLHYPYSLLQKPILWEGVFISSVLDIACTKLLTISSRGSKKDFIDLYFILRQYSLKGLFNLLTQKYPKTDFNQIHILKSLAYFEDAKEQPMPRMQLDISWEEIKKEIIKNIKSYRV